MLERELELGQWECERAVAQRLAALPGPRPHLPDGVLIGNEGRIAIEVELRPKSRSRLTEIALDLGRTYQRVWYFARPALVGALRQIAAECPWGNVEIRSYPPLVAELFNGAALGRDVD